MASPNLTWFFIGSAGFILIIILATQIYVDIMDKNGGEIDSAYSAKYAQIAGYNKTLQDFQEGLTDPQNRSIWTNIPTFLGNTFNVLAIGISAVSLFFDLGIMIPNLATTILSNLNLPSAFIWFILVVLGIYIVTKVYKAIRGQPDET